MPALNVFFLEIEEKYFKTVFSEDNNDSASLIVIIAVSSIKSVCSSMGNAEDAAGNTGMID